MEINSVSTPEISQISRLRAATGDGRLSAESLEAIRQGALSPVVVQAEQNAAATETAEPNADQSLQDAVQTVRAQVQSNAIVQEDVIDISTDALQRLAESDVTEEPTGSEASTSQNLAQTQNADTATVALGNTVDVNT